MEYMIKFIIFDLDGVLVDAKMIHFNALNQALCEIDEKYIISWEEHISMYDGLKTNQKLDMLKINKGLDSSHFEKIWNRKQELTIYDFLKIQYNEDLVNTIKKLKNDFKIGCCSNSIRNTVVTALKNLGIYDFFDIVLGNEDVLNGKPHPEIYWKAMSNLGFIPEETLIVEDSPQGLLAANRSNSNILRVENSNETTYENIFDKIKNIKSKMCKWIDNKLNILIPMAGAGSRFEQAGFLFPKPLIEVNQKPMIQVVVENLNIDANYIYVVQKKHREKYNLDVMLNLITPNCKIIEVDGITEGAACTALMAKEYINNNNPLFFANSDQFVEWNSSEFMYKMQETKVDGGIVTFESTHPKWSFAKVDELGYVTEVAEKNPISNLATVGFYFWKNGSDFVKYAEEMINKNLRINNEFYVCPVFNTAIQDGKKIITFNAKKMWGLGTPEDLEFYLKT